jgi:hypothetical protein
MIKREDAFSIVRKWTEEQTLLRVTAAAHGWGFDLDGFISGFSQDGWVKLQANRTRGTCDFWIGGEQFGFEYGEPRQSVEKRTTEGLVHGPTLVVFTGKDEMFTFSEIEGNAP